MGGILGGGLLPRSIKWAVDELEEWLWLYLAVTDRAEYIYECQL